MGTTFSEQLTSASLVRLLNVKLDVAWTPDDAAAALRHQLEAPLLPDLLLTRGIDLQELESAVRSYTGPQTFGGQLKAKVPLLQALMAIKQFSKQTGEDSANPLSGHGARVLYFASIATALKQCGKRISEKSDHELTSAFQWAAGQPGAASLGGLFGDAVATLNASGARPRV